MSQAHFGVMTPQIKRSWADARRAATAFEESLTELATRLGAHYDEVSKRYRVVYERPDPPGARITMGVTRSGVSVRLFADRRMPEQ